MQEKTMSSPVLTQTPVYVYEKPVRLWHWVNRLVPKPFNAFNTALH